MSLIESKVSLEEITGTDKQIIALYNILIKRTFNISNADSPSLREHVKFVQNHPYIIWYLIKFKSNYIGSAYVMENNCIGINIINNTNLFSSVVNEVLRRHKPLGEIKSVRPPYFYVNISPENKEAEEQLLCINAKKIQSTFSLTSI